MGTRALAILLLAPSVALAQFGTVDPPDINRDECSGTTPTSVVITFTIGVTGGDRYDVYAQTGSCSATQTPSATPVASSTSVDSTREHSLSATMTDVRNRVGITDCNRADDVSYYLCAYLLSGSTILGTAFNDGSSMFQLAIPPRPSISVAPANSALDVSVTPGTADTTYQATDGIRYEAIATPAAGGTPVSSGLGGTGDTTLRINNLVNDQPYDVVAYAYSSALNQGPASASVPGTPKYFASFWEAYQDAGGREQGGCGGGAGALSLLPLLPLALRRRRR